MVVPASLLVIYSSILIGLQILKLTVLFPWAMRMTVDGVGDTMSSPACVGNTTMNVKHKVKIKIFLYWEESNQEE